MDTDTTPTAGLWETLGDLERSAVLMALIDAARPDNWARPEVPLSALAHLFGDTVATAVADQLAGRPIAGGSCAACGEQLAENDPHAAGCPGATVE